MAYRVGCDQSTTGMAVAHRDYSTVADNWDGCGLDRYLWVKVGWLWEAFG